MVTITRMTMTFQSLSVDECSFFAQFKVASPYILEDTVINIP